MADVVCVGQLVADCVGAPIDALPRRGTLEIVPRIELHVGGCASNTAIALAKLGADVALIGRAGRDGFGDFVTGFLEKSGVDVSGVVRDDIHPTAATIVTVHSDAERSFLHNPGANAVFSANDIYWGSLIGARFLHLAGPQLVPAFEGDGFASTARRALDGGLTVTLDTVMNPQSRGWDGIKHGLPFVVWAWPSFEEAENLTGRHDPREQAQVFRDAGVHNVAIKLGTAGCFVLPQGNDAGFIVPALSVAAVDTLGAGDCWSAGFICGLNEGWDAEKTARFANAVGACCVQAYGATTGVRPMAETLALLG